MTRTTRLACTCGKMRIVADGHAIVSTECHCNSCRAAGVRLQALPAAPQLLEPNGGTRSVLHRKDRVRFVAGTEFLKEIRLTPNSKTRRVVATCCNTPVFMEFQSAHWIDLYGLLWPQGTLPPLDLRTMTGDLADKSVLPDDVPNAKRQTVSFYAKLLGAWVAMGFKRPKINFVRGEVHA